MASRSSAVGCAIRDALGGQDSIKEGAFSPLGSRWLPRQRGHGQISCRVNVRKWNAVQSSLQIR